MADDPTKEWLDVADDDLRQVVNNLRGPRPSIPGAVYHCQQAAEKLVKSVLVRLAIDFPRTNDIGSLIGLIPGGDPFVHRFAGLETLTPFASAFRYPTEDPWEMPPTEQVEAWLATLQSLLDSMRAATDR